MTASRKKKNQRRRSVSDFRLELAAGSSRSGKTFLTAKRIAKERRVMVWDAMGEFAVDHRCKAVTADQLRRIAAAGAGGRFAFAAPVTAANFDLFCRCAWLWLRVNARHGHRISLVVEELADVTPPGKAPPAWGEIIRKSLRFNPHIYALTQRPAESDKTVMGNATVLRCHAMARADDRRTMSKELDTDQARIDALDLSRYQYIERDRLTRTLTAGGKGQRGSKIT